MRRPVSVDVCLCNSQCRNDCGRKCLLDCDDWPDYSTIATHTVRSFLVRPTNAERRLPDFAQLINFPDKGGGKGAKSSNGTKQCVMCGKFRRSSAGSGSVAGRRVKTDAAAAEGPLHETAQIIPRQNKGVCTVCDVAVWVVQGQDLEIKWCKGCKNFRPWAAFGDKGLATKCVRCRKRQKEKYATQKISLGTSRAGQLLLNLAPRGGTAVPTSAGSIRKRTTAPSSVLPE